MKQKDKLLEDASYDLIREFRSEKIDPEKVYEFNVKDCCRPIQNPANEEPKPKPRPINIYFDCETYTTKKFKHIPYLVCLKSDKEQKAFQSKYCFEEMLDYLAEQYGSQNFKEAPELKLYAHNSTYDGSFMLRLLMNLRILEKDSKYVSLNGTFCNWKGPEKKYINVCVKDSYRLIPMRLADIPKSLGFKDKAEKEVMYYNMFNHRTMDHITKMSKNELNKYILEFNNNSQNTKAELEEKRNTFMSNLKKWDCQNDDGTYDLRKYSKIYCEIDCQVLKLGMEKWAELWKEIDPRIDVNEFYSLPSLAQYYFKINVCFAGCVQLYGSRGAFSRML